MYSPAQLKAIMITPMISGSMSIVASGTLMVAILKSEKKLTIPSKRILFGLCVSDFFFSLSAALSSLPVPKGQGFYGAIGNVYSCDFQGFIKHIGAVGSLLYNCNLSIYYLCVIRFSMNDVTFRKRIEPFCHLIPIIYGFGGAIYLLSRGYFNAMAANTCWIGPYPMDCLDNPDIECIRGGENPYRARWVLSVFAALVSWIIVIAVMITIIWIVVAQRKRDEQWASGGRRPRPDDSNSSLRNRRRKNSRRSSAEEEGNNNNANDVESQTNTPRVKRSGDSNSSRDPLVFDLKAMREKTQGKSLILKKSPSSQEGVIDNGDTSMSVRENLQDVESNPTRNASRSLDECGDITRDPLVFDLKSMREKTRGQSLIKKPPSSQREGGGLDGLDEGEDASMVDSPLVISSTDSARKGNDDLPPTQTERPASFNSGSRRYSMTTVDLKSSIKSRINRRFSADHICSSKGTRRSTDRSTSFADETEANRSSRTCATTRAQQRSTVSSRGPSMDDASREVKTQALLYIFSFIICWIFAIATLALEEGEGEGDVPFIIVELSHIFTPIQGLFNVLVYCRPYVIGLRSHHPEYSWLKAFYMVIKSGGDNNNAGAGSMGYGNRNQKILDRIRKNHIEMMTNIRQNRRSSMFGSALSTSMSKIGDISVENDDANADEDINKQKDTNMEGVDLSLCPDDALAESLGANKDVAQSNAVVAGAMANDPIPPNDGCKNENRSTGSDVQDLENPVSTMGEETRETN